MMMKMIIIIIIIKAYFLTSLSFVDNLPLLSPSN